MKAVLRHTYGPPELLELGEVDKPVPGDEQLLVRVVAAGVNPLDWHTVTGTPYLVRLGGGLHRPKAHRIGVDFAGRVEAVGRDVTRFSVGDEVYGMCTGAFGDYLCIGQERAVAAKPRGVGFEETAAVPVAALTALQSLRDKGRLEPGGRVLVNGASGGVGTYAVQLAKVLGAHVTAVCSTRNTELVASLGADEVIDYTRQDFTRSGGLYDVIVDSAGSRPLLACRKLLRPGGVLVVVGGPKTNRWIGPLSRAARATLLSLFSRRKMVFMLAQGSSSDLAYLADLLASGKLRSVVHRTYELREVPAALTYLAKGHVPGKLVVRI